MRQVLYVLIDDNGLADQVVGGVTDDPHVANLWLVHNMGHVEEVDLNRVGQNVDARARFFKAARRLNLDITK